MEGLANGRLLDRIEAEGVSVFITCDGHMQSQQSLGQRSFAVITNVAPARAMGTRASISLMLRFLVPN